MADLIGTALETLAKGLELWRDRKSDDRKIKAQKRAAIEAVQEAILATKAYLYDASHGGPNRVTERALSRKWDRAAHEIRDYDHELWQISRIKAAAWADPTEWAKAAVDSKKLKLDLLTKQCDYLLEHGD